VQEKFILNFSLFVKKNFFRKILLNFVKNGRKHVFLLRPLNPVSDPHPFDGLFGNNDQQFVGPQLHRDLHVQG
jgi:hypothetical protein